MEALPEKTTKINKNWGHELIIINNHMYCGKILHLNNPQNNKVYRSSIHYHKLKTETFHILKGYVQLELYPFTEDLDKLLPNKKVSLKQGDTITLYPFCVHSFYCLTESDVLETSTQDFVEDSYKLAPSELIDAF